MARKKVLLRYIQNAASRKSSCIKRLRSLLKKVEELSILCNVTACVVIYDEDLKEPPMHWPEERERVEEILWRYDACPDEKKKQITRESFMHEMMGKYQTKLKRIGRTTNKHEMYDMMYLIYIDKLCQTEFQMSELVELRDFTTERIRDLLRKGEFLVENNDLPPPPPPSPRPVGVPPMPPHPPPPPTFLAQLFFQGVKENLTEEARAIHPNTLMTEGSRLNPSWNFEVGGGSGKGNDPDAVFGYGTLLPRAPVIPYLERSRGGGYLGDIPGIQLLMPGGNASSNQEAEANPGSTGPESTTRGGGGGGGNGH